MQLPVVHVNCDNAEATAANRQEITTNWLQFDKMAQQQNGCTWLEQRVSPEGQTGRTARVQLTLADMPWLLVTENMIVYTPALLIS